MYVCFIFIQQAQSDDEGLKEESSLMEDSQVKAEAKTEEVRDTHWVSHVFDMRFHLTTAFLIGF